ncbi:short chain dehydrogenase [Pandoraea commovens]|uniref:Short chain dehydrogenase n=1 Tax=Pandoraea commovens TaxID=2508289 RepID=A0A5E4SQU7_9BURK|nr:short chain dehydrogenase [Pandoraea commovens]VVD77481.1 short chain dehydrogenase [Pandoraea commovens]
MKILVLGGTGTIGTAVMAELKHHDLISVGKTCGDQQCDIGSDESVSALFQRVGKVGAIISATGDMFFGAFDDMTPAQVNVGLQSKLLGQIRVALIGKRHLEDGGSITLTSGICSHEPIAQGNNATVVNAAVDAFVFAAASEMPRGIRINAVSPSIVTESKGMYGPFFPGFESVDASRVALAYRRSVEGIHTGRTYRVW